MSNLFFAISKLAMPLLEPATWLLALCAVSLALLWRGRYRAARWTLALATLLVAVIFWFPTGAVLTRPLEQAVAPPGEMPAKVDGIITLAGAFSLPLTADHGKPQVGAAAERLTEFVALARRYPDARLAYVGDSGYMGLNPVSEAEAMRRFLSDQGMDPGRVVFEGKSRTTYESALHGLELLKPKPGETWLLITSAVHMPRALGTFRKSGWIVVPYPVSYMARAAFHFDEGDYPMLSTAIKEWAGIAAYRAMGRM